MTLGPVMLDLSGPELLPEERERLRHPLVGGVILFSRNYISPDQLERLVGEIHALRDPQLLVAVDQEGGRIQRFREGFAALPSPALLGALHDESPGRARRLAEASGWLMAAELRAVGVDLSFAPVLDLGRGVSTVIGDRAFHADPRVVVELAHAYMSGMARAGMAATGKHFPGHGSVAADSHLSLPVDDRPFEIIRREDLVPFARLIEHGLPAVMTAHMLYPRVDDQPASFSRFWLGEVLRRRLRFQGVIFSDDLGMAGAGGLGDLTERAAAALTAGCDMVLACNNPVAVARLLDELRLEEHPTSQLRLARMHGRHPLTRSVLAADAGYRQARQMVGAVA
jgi:beta-N-acetylhexosaminidase